MTYGEQEHGLDYLAMLRRRWKNLAIPAALGLLLGLVLMAVLPREYEAWATLGVTSPSMAGGLAPSTQADQVERVRAVTQELLSHEVVEQVARDEQLLERAPIEALVADIRSRTMISLPRRTLQSESRNEPDTFIVTHRDRSPDVAQRVANGLVQVFVDKHSKRREKRAEETSAFLARQLALSRDRLTAAEARVREAKAGFQGRLPEQAMANLQAIAELRQRTSNQELTLRTDKERLVALDQQIEGLKRDTETAAVTEAETRSRERLSQVETALAEARQQYTPRHPEVQRLQEELSRATREMAAAPPPAALNTAGTDPVLRQLMAEREAVRLRIRETESANARAQNELGRYQGLLNETPVIEQQLMSLTQAHEFEKQQYQRLAEQHQAALLGEDLERKQAGERFVVLYPAERPAAPSSPNLLLVLGASVVAGLVAGAGLAAAREFMDRSVYDRRTLEAEYGRVVLAEIPHI